MTPVSMVSHLGSMCARVGIVVALVAYCAWASRVPGCEDRVPADIVVWLAATALQLALALGSLLASGVAWLRRDFRCATQEAWLAAILLLALPLPTLAGALLHEGCV